MLNAPAALLLVAIAASAPSAAASTTPSAPTIGVTVVVGHAVPKTVVPHILDEADAIWRQTDVRFAWQRDGRLPTALRVVIDDDHGAPLDADTPLGWVHFSGDVPDPEIHVSYANAYALLEASQSVFNALLMMPTLQRDMLLGYAMGRALAHELGHYLLASKAHTKTGLMQTRRSAVDLFSSDRSHFRIDDAERSAAAARIMPPPVAVADAARGPHAEGVTTAGGRSPAGDTTPSSGTPRASSLPARIRRR